MHLLLCTDGTPRSEGALAFGPQLAKLLEASVTLLGAFEQPAQEAALTATLADVCARMTAAGIPCETVLHPMPLRHAVIAQATAITYDLVIVGLTERGRLRRWLRGPSSRRILQHVTAPVLVVPFDRPAVRNILLCSGDLWYPATTMEMVQHIALSTGAEVTLLYVIPQPQLSYPVLREVEDAWGALLQTDTLQGRNLKSCQETLRSQGIETGIKLRHGPVTEQILAEIREGEYDMVALGSTYAAQSLRRYFAPGITDRIVEHAGRPVLVVRHK
jgi:nucleotide-binding universal stress UspA family protein